MPSAHASRLTNMEPDPTYFASPADLRRWLRTHHASTRELWVGFYKKATGIASITWPESVDEALCYGWIDGLRKRVDDVRYMIRFTPRRPISHWSAVNLGRVQVLIETRRMRPAGLTAFVERNLAKSQQYAYETRPTELPPDYLKRLKANRPAWAFFQAQRPSYRRAATWWVVSAKRDETKHRRLDRLIDDSAAGRAVPPLTPWRT
jgi:uncharacterized protein YdeI (YjbR/CyaY-like superfamily)